MTGALAEDTARDLRAALGEVLSHSPDVPEAARAALGRLVDVLQDSADAIVFPADAYVSTQRAADVLGVSRMTVVRLIDRGELAAEGGGSSEGGGGSHRRIAVSELARYQTDNARRRRAGLAQLADDITEDTPPDHVIPTR